MSEHNGGDWRPITLTDKVTGRSVSITIFDRELYLSGFFTFDDLWQIYGSENEKD